MQKIILLLIVLAGSLVIEAKANQRFETNSTLGLAVTNVNKTVHNQRIIINPDFQKMVDSLIKGAATNGLACGMFFDRPSGIKYPLPSFYLYVINTTTNYIRGFIHIPFEAMARVDLFDADGKLVTKTAAGKRVGTWTQKQVENWFMEIYHKRLRGMTKSGSLTDFIPPLDAGQVSNHISVSQIFQIKQAGEYTLHLQMRFVQVKEDKSGKIFLQTTWLPAVIAKVQVRPEDITSTNSISNGQTNSPAK